MSIDHFAGSGSVAPDITTGSVVPFGAPSGEQSGLPSGTLSSLQCPALSSPV